MLTDPDRQHLGSLGISETQAREQLRLLEKSYCFLPLDRPCTVGDGIRQLSAEEIEECVRLYETAARDGRFQKFVPASGAATRMFQSHLACFAAAAPCTRPELLIQAKGGSRAAQELITFFDNLGKFAFYEDLRALMDLAGHCLEDLLAAGQYREILAYLLTDQGLGYQQAPKWLMKFHHYPTGSRTPLEEHLVEAALYGRDGAGVCRQHFTLSPEPPYQEKFAALLQAVRPGLEARYHCHFDVTLSVQKPATNTLAMEGNNRPCREPDGSLHLRPGGHGALLTNLHDLQGDLVFIKNIDNVVPDRLKEPLVLWKKILGGLLVYLQERVRLYLRRLREGLEETTLLHEAAGFAQQHLSVPFPMEFYQLPISEQRAFLEGRLNRPLRVCGMVKNEGEPGGGPFWVRDRQGQTSLQIVEGAQVDFNNPGQRAIWAGATHFNPVDMVCALRDDRGWPFDLHRYVDHEAVFIAEKFRNGEKIKALELPGLWNGAMADWLTVFVEVPGITFNPVKTVFDLLRPPHQPG